MLNGQRYSFTERKNDQDQSIIMPYLPITLSLGNRSIEVMALLDSGASVSVLPYEIGRELGAVWENQTLSIPLSGNLAQSESRGLVLTGTVANFSPVLLGFAWSMSNDMSVILGHMNFMFVSKAIDRNLKSVRSLKNNYIIHAYLLKRHTIAQPPTNARLKRIDGTAGECAIGLLSIG